MGNKEASFSRERMVQITVSKWHWNLRSFPLDVTPHARPMQGKTSGAGWGAYRWPWTMRNYPIAKLRLDLTWLAHIFPIQSCMLYWTHIHFGGQLTVSEVG